MTRFTISGLEHMIRLLSTKPELMSLSSLAPLQTIANKAREAGKSCGCHVGEVYRQNKPAFELALTNLTHGDHLVMKRVLNVEQLCYYTRNAAGKLTLKCI